MKFAIEIGEKEKHRLEYEFNQLLGRLTIKVNDRSVTEFIRLVNEPQTEVHAFMLGNHEKSSVRIEKERKPLLGHRNCVYVNNRLVRVYDGL